MPTIRRYPEGVTVSGAPEDFAARVRSPAKAPREYLSSGLSVAACGPMFAWDPANRIVRPLTAVRDRAAQVSLPSTEPDVGGSVYVLGGRARWCDGAAFPDAATVAVQGFPSIVVAGRVAVSGTRDNEAVARVAVGIDAEGRVVIGVATALSMIAFARWMIAAGITHAAYMDGGSAAGVVDDAGSLAFGGGRAVPSVVGFRSSSSSSWDPTPVLLALLAASAWRRARR